MNKTLIGCTVAIVVSIILAVGAATHWSAYKDDPCSVYGSKHKCSMYELDQALRQFNRRW